MSLSELLGAKLLKGSEEILTADAFSGKKAVAIYFSAHWCPPCRGFTPKLAEMYTADLQKNGLEVVFASSDRDEASFTDYYKEMPWLAIPFAERSIKDALSKKFKIQGIPSLIILNTDGTLITKDGRGCVTADPTGAELPWHPKTLKELIGNEFLTKDGKIESFDAVLSGKKFGIYFSAHWCPPCRGFTPKFAETYKKIKASNPNFEVIFASSDRDEDSFKEYYNEMPWAAIPFADRKRKEDLGRHFECNGIPMLVIVDEDLNVINKNAVGKVRSDNDGASFPWAPELIRDVNADCDGIDEAPSLVVLMEKVSDDALKNKNKEAVKPIAESYAAEAKKAGEDSAFNFFVANTEGDISKRIRDECGVAKWESSENKLSNFAVVLMDIEDSGAYYRYEKEDFSTDSIKAFLNDYKEKKLTRKQMGSD